MKASIKKIIKGEGASEEGEKGEGAKGHDMTFGEKMRAEIKQRQKDMAAKKSGRKSSNEDEGIEQQEKEEQGGTLFKKPRVKRNWDEINKRRGKKRTSLAMTQRRNKYVSKDKYMKTSDKEDLVIC